MGGRAERARSLRTARPQTHRGARIQRYRKAFAIDRLASRGLDIAVAGTALVIMAPALVLLAMSIWLSDGASPIFVHWRIGRGGGKFPCLKFRTMVPDSQARLQHLLATDAAAAEEWRRDHKLRDDPRITKFGQFLRKSSLDEIPQLANVLVGHMSLVGPRPIIEGEIARYGRYFQHYCRVRPGLTGLWQVSGRNAVSYRRRVAIDTTYVRRQSLPTDLVILQRTLPAVLSGRGSS